MDLEKVVFSLGVVLVCGLAILTSISFYDDAYGTDIAGTYDDQLQEAYNLTNTNLEEIGLAVGQNSIPQSGSTGDTQEAGLLSQGWSTITKLGDLLGLVPSLIGSAASSLGIPNAYVKVAKWVFLLVFGLTIAYILLLGVKKFTSL